MVEPAEFGQLGHQCAADRRADTRHRPQQVVALAPDRAAADRVTHLIIYFSQQGCQPVDVAHEVVAHSLRSATQAGALGHEHLGELTAAQHQRVQLGERAAVGRARLRLHGLTEARLHLRVEPVSLR